MKNKTVLNHLYVCQEQYTYIMKEPKKPKQSKSTINRQLTDHNVTNKPLKLEPIFWIQVYGKNCSLTVLSLSLFLSLFFQDFWPTSSALFAMSALHALISASLDLTCSSRRDSSCSRAAPLACDWWRPASSVPSWSWSRLVSDLCRWWEPAKFSCNCWILCSRRSI